MAIKNLVFALATLAIATHGFGDTVLLSRGAQVDGQIVRETEAGNVKLMIVKVDDDLSVAIPQSRVRKSTKSEQDLAAYAVKAKAAGEDAEANYQLGRWCKGEGLTAQSEYHYRRAIQINPNHNLARKALGYVRKGSDWILFEDQQRERGLIWVSRDWRVPEEYIMEKNREEADVKAKRWLKEFARLRTTYLKASRGNNPQRANEAFEAIRSIDDPFAARAFATALENSRGNNKDPRKLRELYVKKLAAFKSVAPLVKAGLEESDAHIRDLALERLQEYGAPSAVATYLAIVRRDNAPPAQIEQALRGLQFFPDPELWETYVDALVTQHKVKVGGGPGISTGFGGGGSGLAMGGKEKIRIDNVQHSEAIELLRMIAPDVNHRYDKQAWRQYFANQLMQTPGGLRRDP